jgi:hypothetical protein
MGVSRISLGNGVTAFNGITLLPVQSDVTVSNSQKLSGLQPNEFGGAYTGESINTPYAIPFFKNESLSSPSSPTILNLTTLDFSYNSSTETDLALYNEALVYINFRRVDNGVLSASHCGVSRIIMRKNSTANNYVFQLFPLASAKEFGATSNTVLNEPFVNIQANSIQTNIDGETQHVSTDSKIDIVTSMIYFGPVTSNIYVKGLILFSF